jgi:hypothetical protein
MSIDRAAVELFVIVSILSFMTRRAAGTERGGHA